MTLLKPSRGRCILLAALIPIALAVRSVLAQDLDDDSALKSAILHEEVIFRKKMTVTLSPYSSCDSGAVCLQFLGSSGVGKDNVTFYGNFQVTDCEPDGTQTCCNTFGSDNIDTPGIVGSFSTDYTGLTCSESDSEEMFHGPTVVYVNDGWGKGTRRFTYDPQTGTGTLFMLDYLHVPRPAPSHRCGTQRCTSKGCCDGGCCIVCPPFGRGCP
jgi:hypothetical protein